MSALKKLAFSAFAFAPFSAVLAEGTGAEGLITEAQSTVTGYITNLSTALAAVLVAGLTLKALPWVARKVGAFFRG